jgi:hypothetical protein
VRFVVNENYPERSGLGLDEGVVLLQIMPDSR